MPLHYWLQNTLALALHLTNPFSKYSLEKKCIFQGGKGCPDLPGCPWVPALLPLGTAGTDSRLGIFRNPVYIVWQCRAVGDYCGGWRPGWVCLSNRNLTIEIPLQKNLLKTSSARDTMALSWPLLWMQESSLSPSGFERCLTPFSSCFFPCFQHQYLLV